MWISLIEFDCGLHVTSGDIDIDIDIFFLLQNFFSNLLKKPRRYEFDEEHVKMFTKIKVHSILTRKTILLKVTFTVVNKTKEMLKC